MIEAPKPGRVMIHSGSPWWPLLVEAYEIIKGLEDGCTVKDIRSLLKGPAETPIQNVSKVVSLLCCATNSPVKYEQQGRTYVKLQVIEPLPDKLYAGAPRVNRASKAIVVANLDRIGLLKLKLQINQRLAELDKEVK